MARQLSIHPPSLGTPAERERWASGNLRCCHEKVGVHAGWANNVSSVPFLLFSHDSSPHLGPCASSSSLPSHLEGGAREVAKRSMVLRQGEGGIFLSLPWGRASGSHNSLCGARNQDAGTACFLGLSGGRTGTGRVEAPRVGV